MTTTERMQVVQEIVDRWVATLNPTAVLIFGSTARNTTHPDSDIDLIVVWDDPSTSSNRNRRMKLKDIAGNVPYPIDIITYTNDEWNTAIANPLSFSANIAKEAKVIYGRLH